ncbi:hypothetical protein [Pseudanabaena sp. UWO310]|uniref:hypothetical protein n=1 Tax=Pseudanabaena sp. UWO310 TaxID=2480795 RepID=UPI00115AB85C|nr:hypothetical protein [Pseudanabaena sp. UWO310]TYQ30915.1 hypothetical protein PseudUWO310_06105 [Pseudanabaena sp. UWO310]
MAMRAANAAIVATLKKNTLMREFGRANLVNDVNTIGFARDRDRGCIRPNNINNILAVWANESIKRKFFNKHEDH